MLTNLNVKKKFICANSNYLFGAVSLLTPSTHIYPLTHWWGEPFGKQVGLLDDTFRALANIIKIKQTNKQTKQKKTKTKQKQKTKKLTCQILVICLVFFPLAP